MKSLLIHNFTRRNVHLVEAFLRKHKLYNIHAIVPGEDFNDDTIRLLNRYGLNVILPLQGVEDDHQSVVEIEKRNPGFEKRVVAFPKHKLQVLRRSTGDADPTNVVGLALNFPGVTVRALRGTHLTDAFYHEFEVARKTLEEMGDEAEEAKLLWGEELENDFQFIDFGLLVDLGIAGESGCLVTTK
ncbi:hypothetical protein PARSHIK_172 [Erwinia phage vB_EamM_Parshik]|nr:hypothetical protein PARSHIK_172 [Erwinia phage vB_EamM_Parshik]